MLFKYIGLITFEHIAFRVLADKTYKTSTENKLLYYRIQGVHALITSHK